MRQLLYRGSRVTGVRQLKRGAVTLQAPYAVTPSRLDGERLGDILSRAVIIVLFSFMAVRFGADFLQTGRLTNLLLLVSEMLVVALTVLRRSAATVDRSMRARLLTTVSLLGPPLVKPAQMIPLLSASITVSGSIIGLAIVIAGKLTLGRSFGLMPANRGIVSSGVYRLVRHPIYLGYLITHVAFIFANPTAWNVAVLTLGDIALLLRAVCEEETLARDASYQEYQQVVRWRICPGVF
jgi:protein-S-isoprenylcysteine O-methyltransferase Ste14